MSITELLFHLILVFEGERLEREVGFNESKHGGKVHVGLGVVCE